MVFISDDRFSSFFLSFSLSRSLSGEKSWNSTKMEINLDSSVQAFIYTIYTQNISLFNPHTNVNAFMSSNQRACYVCIKRFFRTVSRNDDKMESLVSFLLRTINTITTTNKLMMSHFFSLSLSSTHYLHLPSSDSLPFIALFVV